MNDVPVTYLKPGQRSMRPGGAGYRVAQRLRMADQNLVAEQRLQTVLDYLGRLPGQSKIDFIVEDAQKLKEAFASAAQNIGNGRVRFNGLGDYSVEVSGLTRDLAAFLEITRADIIRNKALVNLDM